MTRHTQDHERWEATRKRYDVDVATRPARDEVVGRNLDDEDKGDTAVPEGTGS